jgi:hypothetical protein
MKRTRRRRPRIMSPAVAALEQQVARVFGPVEIVACRPRPDARAPEMLLLPDLDVATDDPGAPDALSPGR